MSFFSASARFVRYGPILWNRDRQTVNAVPPVARMLREFYPEGVFGDVPFEKKRHWYSHEVYPLPGRPDHQWLVSSYRKERPDGKSSSVTRVGLIVGSFVKKKVFEFELQSPSKATGVFAFRKAVLSPDGSLALPGRLIRPDLSVEERPDFDENFQGFLWDRGDVDGKSVIPVSDFQSIGDSTQAALLPKYANIFGYLLWGGNPRRSVWITWSLPLKDRGTLALIDLSTQAVGKLEDGVLPQSAFSLPDGRWAALARSPSGGIGLNLVVGREWDYRLFTPDQIGFPLYGLQGVFPVTDKEWVVVAKEGLIYLDEMSLVDATEVCTDVVAVFPSALLTGQVGKYCLILSDEGGVSTLPTTIGWMGLGGIYTSQNLGCIWYTLGYMDQVYLLLLPSGKTLEIDWSGIHVNPEMDAGENGYLVADEERGQARLRFFDEAGGEVGFLHVGMGVELDDVRVVPVGRKCFLIAVQPRRGREGEGVVLRTVAMGGAMLQELRLEGSPPRVLFVERKWHNSFTDARLMFFEDGGRRIFGKARVFDDGTIQFEWEN